jgi:hypothetical protein
MRLDPDIDEVEARIVQRRHAFTRVTQETSRRALQMLSSPGALAGAAALGFLAGGGAARRHHDSAKRTGVIGALMTGAMWLVRARFGSAAGLARHLMARRHAATAGRPSAR